MFTGIIESLGKIKNIQTKASNGIFTIQADFASEVKVGDSIAVDGCCLTCVDISKDNFKVEVIVETLKTTNLSTLKIGDRVNLERARQVGERLDGHLVQGHIDENAKITSIKKIANWFAVQIEVSRAGSKYVVDKGSIAIDGISLTIAEIKANKIWVNIIPFTFEHTNLKYKRIGGLVNLEFDLIAKYVKNFLK